MSDYARQDRSGAVVLFMGGILLALLLAGFWLMSSGGNREMAEKEAQLAIEREREALLEDQYAKREATGLATARPSHAPAETLEADMPHPQETVEEPAAPAAEEQPAKPLRKGQQQAVMIEDHADVSKLNAKLEKGWRVVHLSPMGSLAWGKQDYSSGKEWRALAVLEWQGEE